ncbi:hypothetical protein ACQ4PT_027172 [Festuca glaucescens]
MDGALHYGDPLHYRTFDWICILTAVFVPPLALIGPINAWRKRDLGAGGRRPEPAVSALVGNASWLLFGWTEALVEPLGLNLWGGGCQMPGLLVFLWLCTPAERKRALRGPICVAVIYLALLSGFGASHHIHLGLYQFLCTAAGVVAAAAPVLAFFFTENASDQLLPHWIILASNAIHAFLWCVRGVSLSFNHYMLIQNLAGFVSSLLQLSIKLVYPLLDIDYGDFLEGSLVFQPVIHPFLQEPPRVEDEVIQSDEENDDDDDDKGDDDDKNNNDNGGHNNGGNDDNDDNNGGNNNGGDNGSSSNNNNGNNNGGKSVPGDDNTSGKSVPGEVQPPAPQDATSSGTSGVSSGKDVPPRRSDRLALASNKTPSKPTPAMGASSKTPSKPTPAMVASNKTPSKLTMVLRSSTTRNTPTSGSESSSTTANIPAGSGSRRRRQR